MRRSAGSHLWVKGQKWCFYSDGCVAGLVWSSGPSFSCPESFFWGECGVVVDGHVPDAGLWFVSGLLRDGVSLGSAGRVPVSEYLAGWLGILGRGMEVPVDHCLHVGLTHSSVGVGQFADASVD